MIVFAFDASRTRSHPSLALSLAADREFLEHLANLKGDEWLKSHIVAAIRKYQIEVAEAGIDETFVDEYRSTLGELVNTGLGQDSEDLKRTINEALTTARLPPIG